MREASSTYNALEEGIEKKPSELFHFWKGSDHWYYTNHDEIIWFNVNEYRPAPIERETQEYNSDLNTTSLIIAIGAVSHPIVKFLARNPVETVWVQVSRMFRNMTDDEAAVIFVGTVQNISFKGQQANVQCVGFEEYLRQSIPIQRYQIQCNHQVFDSGCGLSDSGYKVSNIIVSIDDTKSILTATEFSAENDGYWVFGYVEWNDQKRMILKHDGNDIHLSYPFFEMPASGGTVDIWPGCDGHIETCKDKFNNVSRALSFPDIPKDNPVTWT